MHLWCTQEHAILKGSKSEVVNTNGHVQCTGKGHISFEDEEEG